jgi:hypothetical protein
MAFKRSIRRWVIWGYRGVREVNGLWWSNIEINVALLCFRLIDVGDILGQVFVECVDIVSWIVPQDSFGSVRMFLAIAWPVYQYVMLGFDSQILDNVAR